MTENLIEIMRKWCQDRSTAPRLVFVSGAGDKNFCVGGDLTKVYNAFVNEQDSNVSSAVLLRTFFFRWYLAESAMCDTLQ